MMGVECVAKNEEKGHLDGTEKNKEGAQEEREKDFETSHEGWTQFSGAEIGRGGGDVDEDDGRWAIGGRREEKKMRKWWSGSIDRLID